MQIQFEVSGRRDRGRDDLCWKNALCRECFNSAAKMSLADFLRYCRERRLEYCLVAVRREATRRIRRLRLHADHRLRFLHHDSCRVAAGMRSGLFPGRR